MSTPAAAALPVEVVVTYNFELHHLDLVSFARSLSISCRYFAVSRCLNSDVPYVIMM